MKEKNMTETVADFLLARLRDWGVRHVFAYPGDGINGIVGHSAPLTTVCASSRCGMRRWLRLQRRGMRSSAAGSGCMATSGPGPSICSTGSTTPNSTTPVVAIVGQTARSAMGGSYQQEIDLQSLYKDVASDYLVEVNVAEQLPNALDRAIRIAQARRGPTAVIIPPICRRRTSTPGTRVQAGALQRSRVDWPLVEPSDEAVRARSRDSQRRIKGRDPYRAGREVRPQRSAEVAEMTGAGVAKGAVGQRRPARRSALRHRGRSGCSGPVRATN